jgi:hypothetical protein
MTGIGKIGVEGGGILCIYLNAVGQYMGVDRMFFPKVLATDCSEHVRILRLVVAHVEHLLALQQYSCVPDCVCLQFCHLHHLIAVTAQPQQHEHHLHCHLHPSSLPSSACLR